MAYSRADLPIHGVRWTWFATLREAERFARWAERTTSRDEYPCDAFISDRADMPVEQRYEVKVRNW